MTSVTIELSTPDVDDLGDLVTRLRDWQSEASPLQLHPGDLGWNWRAGADMLAPALRTWARAGQVMAIGFLDSPDVLRMTVAPDAFHDEAVAARLAADLSDPARGVLPSGAVSVEAPNGSGIQCRLTEDGWELGERWSPLRLDLADPVEPVDLRVETVGPDQVADFTTVHRSAWNNPSFTDAKWHVMAAGTPFAGSQCLVAYDERDVPVAGVTVWSAGRGRPALTEPLGVHTEHRHRGYARAICLAAAARARAWGASSVQVCTPSSLVSAVATYRSAGFEPLPERRDRQRAT